MTAAVAVAAAAAVAVAVAAAAAVMVVVVMMVVAAAATTAMAVAVVAATADGGEGTMTSSTVREHLWISAIESLTSYHHRTTAEPRGTQVEPNGNGNAARNETRGDGERSRSPKTKGKRSPKDTWQSLPRKRGIKAIAVDRGDFISRADVVEKRIISRSRV